MVKKLLLTLGIIVLLSSLALAQSGTIKGTVTDQSGGALEFAQVLLKKEGNVVNYAMTDGDGNYQMHGVSAGTYDIEFDASLITSCGKKGRKQGVKLENGKTIFENFSINCGAQDIDEITIVWKEPVFDADNTTSSTVLDVDAVRKTPGRSVTAALASSEGVVSIDGSMTSVRGSRSDGQQTMIDGMVVRGTGGVSMASIEQVELIQGGIPAEYGDGTSFTVITTKGISKNLHGSAELMGSLDGYNNFLAAFSLTGPLLKGKKSTDPARIGFMITADGSYNKDSRPLQGGSWKATDEAIDYLMKNPIRYDEINFGANYATGEYMTSENFKKQRVKDHAYDWNYLLQGKLDFLLGKSHNINFSIGGMYEFTRARSWSQSSALYNSANGALTQNTTWRVNAKFNHRITPDTSSVFNNIMYNINVNFTKVNQWTRDIHHKENFFDYGHIGYYKTHRARSFSDGNDTITMGNITYHNMHIFNGYYDSLVEFSATPFGSNDESLISNPQLLYYVTNFLEEFPVSRVYDYFGTIPYDKTLYEQFGAILNGQGAYAPYGMFSAPGSVYNGFERTEETQIGASASLSLAVKNHDIKLGYIFEKRTSRSFSISPVGLWTLMRTSANSHINELDLDHPYIVGVDTVMYDLLNNGHQTNFDRNLRKSLGLNPDGTDWIDIDNMSPDQFDLSLFSPEELFNQGSSYISYYGYDYTGAKRNRKKTNIDDFFNKRDENGNKTYEIGAYEPIYMAFYIQDKFSIQTLLFNLGLRIDYFDANQAVLKDPYLFRDALTVGDVRGKFLDGQNNDVIPSNASDDWVVYVNQMDKTLDAQNSSIVAFRDGHTWYDARGAIVTDPTTVLGATGGPILRNAIDSNAISKVSSDAFEDYKPTPKFMPRLSFSFPVSNKSLFYAHYNIITSRPTALRLNPISYLWIEKYGPAATSVNNPNLKPQQSIDYEIGFRQAIGENSAISLAAYYSEKRNQIQAYRYTGAYPTTYYSFDNIDFGTVQGFTLSYDLRRTKNVTLRASYTLQFAKGTGSSETSGKAIIQSGQPNLRTLTNLSFDQRHRLSANIDYRFGAGVDYNGPTVKKEKNGKLKETRIFENMGININFSAGSGLPYSRSSKPYSALGMGGKSQLSGTINGSNMPWIYQCDIRLDKTFMLNLKKNEEGDVTKKGYLNVYLEVMNIFNFKNVIYVYEYTGNPDDDGYLTASEYQQQINSQVSVASYTDYYRMLIRDPYNYTMPTRVRLGVSFSF